MLNRIQSFGPVAGNGPIQDLNYNFDTLGNLTSRRDDVQALNETFLYDTLNRVTSITTGPTGQAGTTATVAYDSRGNITARSDIGTYTYAGTGSCGAGTFSNGAYAVKAISGSKNASYCYDLNGDMVTGDGRTVTWSAFGLPVRVEKGTNAIDITYGPGRARSQDIGLDCWVCTPAPQLRRRRLTPTYVSCSLSSSATRLMRGLPPECAGKECSISPEYDTLNRGGRDPGSGVLEGRLRLCGTL